MDEGLPFTPSSATLRDVLRRDFIARVARWLVGAPDDGVLAQNSGSVWEAAMTGIFLIDASQVWAEAGEELEFRNTIRSKVANVARWLLARREEHDGVFCWEGVTWDTAVVIRALHRIGTEYSDNFSHEEHRQFREAIISGTKWLFDRFTHWESQVKYPFGSADVAQILTTHAYLRLRDPSLMEEIVSARQEWESIDIAIARYLLQCCTSDRFTTVSDDEVSQDHTRWWGDFFSSAEVVESLGRFFELHREDKLFDDALRQDLEATVSEACSHFDHTQQDGMWGTHVDTARTVYGYLSICRTFPHLKPEPHIMFKALRWLCDRKQIMSDGSFLHTHFLTIFYAHALIEVYTCWPPACETIEKLYDDVVWAAPMRTTPERVARLAADLKSGELERELARQKGRRRTLTKVLASILSVFVVAAAVFGVAAATSAIAVKGSVLHGTTLAMIVGIGVPLLLAALSLVWRYDDMPWV